MDEFIKASSDHFPSMLEDLKRLEIYINDPVSLETLNRVIDQIAQAALVLDSLATLRAELVDMMSPGHLDTASMAFMVPLEDMGEKATFSLK